MARKLAGGDGAAIGFLLLLNALYFLPVLIKGNDSVLSAPGGDTWSQFFYWRHFAYERLTRGEIPLWNPFVFSGTPFLAGIQSALFYPLNLLFLFFPTPFAINLSIALHCLLASLFTYFYARYIGVERSGSILSGVAFAYGAPLFLHVLPGHLAPLSTMIWLPLLFLGVEAFLGTGKIKFMLLSGGVVAVQLFAGYPQYLFYSALTVSVYLFVRVLVKRQITIFSLLRGTVVFLVAGMLLAAVQLLPTAEFLKYSFREELSFEWVAIFSLPPENLITILIPDFFGNAAEVPYWGENYLWETSIYLGIIPITLAVVASISYRRDRVLAFSIIAGSALILALGKYTPLLEILYNFVPGFDRFRGLSKFVFVFSFAVAMLAGFGLSKLADMAETQDRRLVRFSYVVLAISIFLLLLAIATPLFDTGWWHSLIESYAAAEVRFYSLPPITDAFVNAAMSAAFRSLLTSCALLAVLGVCLLVLAKKKALARFLPAALVLLAVADLWHFGFRYLVTFSPQQLGMDRGLKAFLMRDPEPYRIASPLDQIINVGIYEGIENVGGYDTLVAKRYSDFINMAQGMPLNEPTTDTRVRVFSSLFDLLNVKYFIVSASTKIEQPDFQLAFENPRYHVYRNQRVLPRSFIVHDVRVIEDGDEVLRRIAAPGFRPASMAIVEEKAESLAADAKVTSPSPRLLERSLNRVLLEASLAVPGFLVLADVFYPGWKCFVDGKETKIFRANYVMRGVFLPAGRHRVEFRFDPLSFKIGGVISVTTLLVISGWLFWSMRRKASG